MQTAYLFRVGPVQFIINIQYSTIGFSYPRIFIAWPDNSYTNLDLTLGAAFSMSESDWLSWYDDELVTLNDIDEVHKIAAEHGLNIDVLIDWAMSKLETHKGED